MLGIVMGFISLVMSIVLLMGKGAFLIAGYNTASKAEKAKYDEKKLCRIMGFGMLFMTIGLFILALDSNLSVIFFVCFTIGMIICLVGPSAFCKNKGYVALELESDSSSRWIKRGSFILTIFIFVGIGILLYSGDVSVELNKDAMQVHGFFASSTNINYEEIKSIKLEDDVQLGSRIGGFGGLKLSTGNFENDEFGKYKLYSYNGCDLHIVVETENRYVVFNKADEKTTQELYHDIMRRIK